MNIEKWFIRKTTHGATTVVHAIEHFENIPNQWGDEQEPFITLLCRPEGRRKPSTVIKVTNGDEYRHCPGCVKALADRVALRLQEGGKK